MLRFTIRDVLWLTVVVAMALGWRLHSGAFSSDEMQSSEQRNRLLYDNESARFAIKQLKQQVNDLEIKNHDLTKENKRSGVTPLDTSVHKYTISRGWFPALR